MAPARVPSRCHWTASDRALLDRVARRMIRAGIWQSIEIVDVGPAGPVALIRSPQRTDPVLEFSRVRDGRYVVIDRRSDTVSFHDSLAAALTQVAYVP